MPADTLFLQQQLEYVQNTVVKQDFPEMLMASGTAIDISKEIPVGAETYSYQILTFVGEALILANGADDIPMINAYAEKRIGEIKTLVDGYSYTVEDIEHAQFAGINLNAQFAIGAREILERKFDILGYTGDSRYNLLGFVNHPNVPSSTVTNDGNQNGGSNSTRWRHKTADQIYRDLSNFATSMRIATNGAYSMEAIALPEEEFGIINNTPYPANSSAGKTILSFFLETQRQTPAGVQSVYPMAYLAGQGAGGTDMMVGYQKRADRLVLHMPLDFTQQPVQMTNLSYKVPCRMKTGGVQVTKPLSMRYAIGI